MELEAREAALPVMEKAWKDGRAWEGHGKLGHGTATQGGTSQGIAWLEFHGNP